MYDSRLSVLCVAYLAACGPVGVITGDAGGARFVDRDLDVTVTRVLQTVAGRMIFAQPRLD